MGKTLKELNVKPGDVVRYKGRRPHIVDFISGDEHHMKDGISYLGETPNWEIISRATPEIDLTAITTPLGLLDDATRDALKAHGGPYQRYSSDGWSSTSYDFRDWPNREVIRVKPSPKVEAVELYGSEELHWIFSGSPVDCDTHKLTLKIQSGEIIGVTAEKLI